MNTLLKGAGGVIILLALTALCLALITVPSCSGLIDDASAPPQSTPPPSTGTCENVGVEYPDNPFSGWPVSGGVNWGVITAYYCDPEYFQQFGTHHYGIDLGYPEGTPVVGTANGSVSAAGWHDLMGLYVRVCADGWCSTYMHLSSIAVTPGQEVAAGSVLGLVGSTGNSTGPHLHYQINDPAWNTVDPAPTMD